MVILYNIKYENQDLELMLIQIILQDLINTTGLANIWCSIWTKTKMEDDDANKYVT